MRRQTALLILASIVVSAPVTLYAQGYGGPSLLSRGGNSPGRRGRAPVSFQAYGAVRGTYETGLIAPQLQDDGSLPSQDLQGVQVEGGAYGAKALRRSSIGLDYRGDYRWSDVQAFNGTNQALSFDFMSEPSRRIGYYVRQTAGTTNRAFGGFSAPAFADQDNFGVPLNEVYDSRVYFSQTSAGLTYMQSARTMYRISGDAFIVKRVDPKLIDMQGFRGGADVIRRLSRSTQLGGGYSFVRFVYPGIYGGSDIHMLYGTIDRRINRNIQLLANLGVFTARTFGTQQITLSPEVAAVLGRTVGVEAFKRIVTAPQVQVVASYTLERSRFNATFNSGINPGNGVYITTRADSFRLGYSYTGIRKLSLGASAGYSRQKSVGLVLGDFSNRQSGGGLSYKIAQYWSFSLQADRRNFDSPGVSGRSGVSIVAGISFSPGSVPLSIW